MSLPDNPNTLRETYYSVMAGQNDASILPDIETAPSTENRYLDYIARNGGGGGGGDVSGVKGDAEETYRTGNVNITAANVGAYTKTETDTLLNSKADTTDVDNVKIASTATNTSITITDSADGYVQAITVKGRSEEVSGEIVSVGDNGLDITTTGANVLENGISSTFTVNDVIITPQSDGTLILSGTSSAFGIAVFNFATAASSSSQNDNKKHIPNGTYRIVFTDPKCALQIRGSNSDSAGDAGNEITITNSAFTIDDTYKYNWVRLTIANGAAFGEGTVIKPMIVSTSTYSEDMQYEPYKSSTAEITTGLPLRSTLDGTVYDELTSTKVITRCEVVEGDVVPLAPPVETPLTSAEIAALAALQTYNSITHIDATDAPIMTVNYLLNTNNGQAVARIDDKLASKVDKVQGKGLSTEDYTTAEKTKLGTVETNATANTVINTSCTLAANGWTGASAPYTQTVNVASIQSTDHAYVDLSVSSTTATGIDEIENWAYISKVESGTGTLTFTCYEDKPDVNLNVNVQVVRGTNSGTNLPVLKSVTWTGTGTTTNAVTFPEKPSIVLSIQSTNKDTANAGCMPFRYGAPSMFCAWSSNPGSWGGNYNSRLSYSANEMTMTITGSDKGSAWNDETTNYILYYI